MQDHRELGRQLRSARDDTEWTEIIGASDVSFVDVRFADLPGRWHHVTVPAARATEALFRQGVGFDGSSVPGFKTVEEGDMVLLPDRATAVVDELGGERVVSLIATVGEADSKAPFPLDPRVIAAKAEDALRRSAQADLSIWSPELEFYVFSEVSYDNEQSGAHYRVWSDEVGWRSPDVSEDGTGYRIRPRSGYHAIPPADAHYDFRNEVTARMEEAGIPVKYHHHESGAAGQMEVEMLGESLVRSADNLMLAKYIIKNTAHDWGLAATFMPKPLAGEAGNGLHFHIRLMLSGRPVFHGENGYAGLSQEALYFIGGILSHGRSLAALTNPSTNSYRRLRPGYQAPTQLFFSSANRSAAIRIPKYATEPETKTIEYRPADSTANPYIAMSALLAAGLDGLTRELDPRAAGFGPFEANMQDAASDKRHEVVPLPVALEEALSELEGDSEFLTASGIFPDGFVSVWAELKAREAEEVRTRPHPIEYSLYFDC